MPRKGASGNRAYRSPRSVSGMRPRSRSSPGRAVVAGPVVGGHHVGEDADGAPVDRVLAVQGSAAVPVRHHAVRHAGERLEHGHGQDVARLGTVDGDRSGDHVRAVPLRVAATGPGDRDRVGEHVLRRDAVAAEEGDGVTALVRQEPLVAHGVDRQVVTGSERHDRAVVAVREPSPEHPVGLGRQVPRRPDRAGVGLEHRDRSRSRSRSRARCGLLALGRVGGRAGGRGGGAAATRGARGGSVVHVQHARGCRATHGSRSAMFYVFVTRRSGDDRRLAVGRHPGTARYPRFPCPVSSAAPAPPSGGP